MKLGVHISFFFFFWKWRQWSIMTTQYMCDFPFLDLLLLALTYCMAHCSSIYHTCLDMCFGHNWHMYIDRKLWSQSNSKSRMSTFVVSLPFFSFCHPFSSSLGQKMPIRGSMNLRADPQNCNSHNCCKQKERFYWANLNMFTLYHRSDTRLVH